MPFQFTCPGCGTTRASGHRQTWCSRACFGKHRDPKPLAVRFWPKVAIGQSEECWLWLASRDSHGYGRIGTANRKCGNAHRVAWALTFGPIPKGLHVLHHCDNPPCCNPGHLFLGTHRENVADMMAKGRHGKGWYKPGDPRNSGEAHHNAKLTTEQVSAIKAEYLIDRSIGIQHRLAERYDVWDSAISRILHGTRRAMG